MHVEANVETDKWVLSRLRLPSIVFVIVKNKFTSVLPQHALNKLSTFFTLSTMLDDLLKRTENLVQQSVECMLKQMLKPINGS